MKIVLAVVGAVIGAALLAKEGLAFGLALGWLAGMVVELRREVDFLRARIGAVAVVPEEADSGSLAASSDSQEAPPELVPVGFDVEEEGGRAAVPPNHGAEPAGGRPAGEGPPAGKPWWSGGSFPAGTVRFIRNFFTGGNLVVRIGILILFLGVAFLLKFAAEHARLPIEFRLTGVMAGGLALLLCGWRLRGRKTPYGLMLQGGGIGIMYLTVFAAAKLYGLVPPLLALVLMVGLVGFSGLLAVMQDAVQLAIAGLTGGFLAPVLLSTGSGSHVMLFGYYALLNAGILGIAWFRAWRLLNVLGFVFTFVIGAAWGSRFYHPGYFATTEPFLLLFFLFYVAIAILFAHRQPPDLKGYVDGTLVFGVPLAAAGLQASLVHRLEFGLAYSALAAGLFYVLLAGALWRRHLPGMRLLTESFLALGVGFGTLAIPLACDDRITAAAWAAEGAALVWIGLRQGRMLARTAGILLQVAAAVFFTTSVGVSREAPFLVNAEFSGALLIAAAGLFSAACYDQGPESGPSKARSLSVLFLGWGVLWWLGAGWAETGRFCTGADRVHAWIAYLGATAWLFILLGLRAKWRALIHPLIGFLPLLAGSALMAWLDHRVLQPLAPLGAMAWLVALSAQWTFLRLLERNDSRPAVMRWGHAGSYWLLTFLLTWEAAWAVDAVAAGLASWRLSAWALVPLLSVGGLFACRRQLTWPVGRHREAYLAAGTMPVLVYLWGWSVAVLASSADPSPLVYLPVINPLEILQLAVPLTIFWWQRQLKTEGLVPLVRWPSWLVPAALAFSVFAALNGMVARSVHAWAGVAYRAGALFHSGLLQTAVAVLWSLTALGIMVFATRAGKRQVWLAGGALLGGVVVKLFAIDLAQTATIERIISFLAVGIFMLLIGYLSPLPPREKECAAS